MGSQCPTAFDAVPRDQDRQQPTQTAPRIRENGVPALIIVARDDPFNTAPAADYAAAQTVQSNMVVFESGGHLPVGHQETVRRRVRDFLKSVTNASQWRGAQSDSAPGQDPLSRR